MLSLNMASTAKRLTLATDSNALDVTKDLIWIKTSRSGTTTWKGNHAGPGMVDGALRLGPDPGDFSLPKIIK